MEFQQQQLDNGLTILAECNPASYSTSIGMFVRAGARDETSEIGGVSHFLEHMVFKGTPRRTAEQVNLELDEMGSDSNARTSHESTVYHSTVLPEFQDRVVDLLCDMMRPSLREDDFETEKKVIIEEILMYDDQPPYGGYEKIMADYFGSHSLGNSVLGTVQTVEGLTSERMRAYHESRYSPRNMALVAAGNVDFKNLVGVAEKLTSNWVSAETERPTPAADPMHGFSLMHKPQSTQEYIIQLASAPASEDPKRYASAVASVIYGSESGSRLYWEFLDSGLAEMAAAGFEDYLGAGLTVSYLCCAPEEAQKNLEKLHAVQEKIERDGFEERELELAKRKIAARIILASERPGTRLFSLGTKWLNGQSYESIAEIAAHYQGVTLEQINEIASLYPLTQNRTLAVGPCESLEPVIAKP